MLLMTSSRHDSLSGSVRTLPCMHHTPSADTMKIGNKPLFLVLGLGFLQAIQAVTLSHLQHSLSQLETRDVGQQMMTRLAMGVPPSSSCPFCSSVHSSVMPCNVFL